MHRTWLNIRKKNILTTRPICADRKWMEGDHDKIQLLSDCLSRNSSVGLFIPPKHWFKKNHIKCDWPHKMCDFYMSLTQCAPPSPCALLVESFRYCWDLEIREWRQKLIWECKTQWSLSLTFKWLFSFWWICECVKSFSVHMYQTH